MAERCKDLPDECWMLIFNKLGHYSHFQSLTLVSKRFLFIVSWLHTTFNLTLPVTINRNNISHIFTQFPNIKSISIRAIEDSRNLLFDQIASSSLRIESLDISDSTSGLITYNRFHLLGQKMKGLKVLKCCNMSGITNDSLAVVADCLPWLEELDISNDVLCLLQRLSVPDMIVTDDGIGMISLKLKGLRKIDVSGNNFLTNKALMVLSTNCGLLEEVVVRECAMITLSGIEFLVKYCRNLKSLSVNHIDFSAPSSDLSTRDAFACARHLSTIHIDDSVVSDEFLYLLAVSNIPLERFSLSYCDGYSCDGITVLLKKYRYLEYLSLIDAHISGDCFVSDLSSSLCMLTTIKLKMCYMTESTLFMLVESCPLLEHIDMGNTIIGSEESLVLYATNSKIKFLSLSCNPYLSDKCLAKLALVCPLLETLDVSYCSGVTKKGVSSFLNRCLYIRDLEINGCRGIKSIGQGSELPRLEVLRAAKSGIDNEGLAIIGKRCCGLLNLVLEGCFGVTTKGLKDALKDLRTLREINLNDCVNVSVEIMNWMVFSRPSLRKMVPPCSSFPNFNVMMKFYLHHGCWICTPPADKEYDNKRYCYFFEMKVPRQVLGMNECGLQPSL